MNAPATINPDHVVVQPQRELNTAITFWRQRMLDAHERGDKAERRHAGERFMYLLRVRAQRQ